MYRMYRNRNNTHLQILEFIVKTDNIVAKVQIKENVPV